MDKETILAEYEELGVKVRLTKDLLSDTIVMALDLYGEKEAAALINAEERMSEFCSNAEKRFHNDYPDFGKEYVFRERICFLWRHFQ